MVKNADGVDEFEIGFDIGCKILELQKKIDEISEKETITYDENSRRDRHIAELRARQKDLKEQLQNNPTKKGRNDPLRPRNTCCHTRSRYFRPSENF